MSAAPLCTVTASPRGAARGPAPWQWGQLGGARWGWGGLGGEGRLERPWKGTGTGQGCVLALTVPEDWETEIKNRLCSSR